MTITEATHFIATRSSTERAPERATSGNLIRLVDAIKRVEPTWVEAVAVVQAVCAQLAPGEGAPALDAIMISPSGTVSFPPAGSADEFATVTAVGRLLSGILRSGDCPMPVWEATERARRAPSAVGTARAFGEALTCFPAAQGAHELQQYFVASRTPTPRTARPATAPFTRHLQAGGLVADSACR